MAYGSRRNLQNQNDRDPPRRERTGAGRRSRVESRRRGPGEPATGRRTRPARRLPPELEARLESDPLFRVMTLDAQTWIDPFSGEAVPAPEGYLKAAYDFLLDQNTWQDSPLMSMQQVVAVKWRYDLLRLLPSEPRMRIFGREGQGWLNPYTGAYVPTVDREDGRVTMKTVTAIASVLAHCPEAQAGQMLDAASLQERAMAAAPSAKQVETARPTPSSHHSTVFGLSDDMKRAQDVQNNMLRELPALEGWDISVHFSPHSGVSGDFYEVLPLPDNRFILILGDVSGHGMQAALVVATALKTLRLLAKNYTGLIDLLGDLNDEIKDDLLPGQFLTLFAGVFDPAKATLSCVLAGHHQLLQLNAKKDIMASCVGRSGMAVGLLSGKLFRQSLKEDRIGIDPGDVLVQYTDGLIEAIDDKDEEFGLHRLVGSLFTHLESAGQVMLDQTVEEVVRWSGGNPDDDLTLLSIHRLLPPDDE